MKFLEAKGQLKGENKMQTGTRPDQRDPRELRRSNVNNPPDTDATREAKKLNVDIAKVTGTGPNGTVTVGDVRAFKNKKKSDDDSSTDSPTDKA